MTLPDPTRTRVTGCMADNWVSLNDAQPALVINAEATPLDLLAWCWGEAVSLEVVAQVLADSQNEVAAADVSALFLHRLSPLVNALHQATADLLNARRAQDGRA